ncbi:unnamed protein product [Enterobius vermicularis]|uniref:Chitin-binding type-2 domain-containing protein n=1 Tax=Enterobius vermicularis TaxID=51028 RepID=A0A0N4VIG8_ENTVE|nr:unnamed protein product [Enterobius vermicularis]
MQLEGAFLAILAGLSFTKVWGKSIPESTNSIKGRVKKQIGFENYGGIHIISPFETCEGLDYGVHSFGCSPNYVISLPDNCINAICPIGLVFDGQTHQCAPMIQVIECEEEPFPPTPLPTASPTEKLPVVKAVSEHPRTAPMLLQNPLKGGRNANVGGARTESTVRDVLDSFALVDPGRPSNFNARSLLQPTTATKPPDVIDYTKRMATRRTTTSTATTTTTTMPTTTAAPYTDKPQTSVVHTSTITIQYSKDVLQMLAVRIVEEGFVTPVTQLATSSCLTKTAWVL